MGNKMEVKFIYDNIQDLFLHSELILMPVDVLKGNIKVFEHVLGITPHAAIKEHFRSQIRVWRAELARRQPDSLYVTKLNGNVELVDDMGEVK